MPRGGARSRSGPLPDPESGRSERRGYSLTALPAEGYAGPTPEFPLEDATSRELVVWSELWRTPQACAWSMRSERWRIPTVALYVRTRVRCEDPVVIPGLIAQLHRYADQIGMTTAGLAEMGWKVAVDEVGVKRATPKPAAPRSSRDRMKVVSG